MTPAPLETEAGGLAEPRSSGLSMLHSVTLETEADRGRGQRNQFGGREKKKRAEKGKERREGRQTGRKK